MSTRNEKAYIDGLTEDFIRENRCPVCTIDEAVKLTTINRRIISEAINGGRLKAARVGSGKKSKVRITCRNLATWFVRLEENSIPIDEAA